MSVSEMVRHLVGESVESMELAPRNGFHLEPRCRVCRNDQVRKKPHRHLAMPAVLRAHHHSQIPSRVTGTTAALAATPIPQTTAAHDRGERNKEVMSVTSNDYVCAPDLVAAAREFTHRDGGCVVSICQLLDELSDKVGDQFRVSPDVHKLVDLIETLWADPHIDQVPNAGVIEFACNEKGHWDDEDPSLFLHELSPGAKRGSIRSHQAT